MHRPAAPPSAEPLALFAVTAPGLEPLAAAELAGMGIGATPEPGGVAWEGTREQLFDANLRLRTASRVLLRIAEFRARTWWELERHAGRVAWERWLGDERAVRLRVTSRKSKLYHQGAVAERLLQVIGVRADSIPAADAAKSDEEDERTDGQLLVVRFLHDRCTLSIDTSGALLHRRGYRQALGRAPLRETLAAALLLGSGWQGQAPLIDPLCGAGTVAIEGALLARRIAPGLARAEGEARHYAFREWPEFDAAAWERVFARAAAEALPASPVPIRASDRDEGAIEAARANAERAGVADDVQFDVRPLSAMEPPPGPGWLATNPPYGVRVGESDALRNLYAALGRTARERCPGWTLALLSGDRGLERQVGIQLTEALRTRNGGIPVRVAVGTVGGGAIPNRPAAAPAAS